VCITCGSQEPVTTLFYAAQNANKPLTAYSNEHHLVGRRQLLLRELDGARAGVGPDPRIDRIGFVMREERETQLRDALRIRQRCRANADASARRCGLRHLRGHTAAEEIVRPAALRRLCATVPAAVRARDLAAAD
jgi:hypothetical protein